MPGETTVGYLTYRLGLDKSKFDQGIKVVKEDLKGMGREGDAADIKLRSLSRDVSILGGSLASMGGLAMGAGLLIGDNGLGKGLTNAGMGVSILGGALSTVSPILRGFSAILQGEVIKSVNLFITKANDAGLAVGVLGGAAVAATGLWLIFGQTVGELGDELTGLSKPIDDHITKLQTWAQVQNDVADAQDRAAGIPKKKEDLELQLVGANLGLERATGYLQEGAKAGLPLEGLEMRERGYAVLNAQDRVNRINAAIANIPAEQAAADAAVAAAQNEPYLPLDVDVSGLGINRPHSASKYRGPFGTMTLPSSMDQTMQGLGFSPISITNIITVGDASEVKTITEDSLNLGHKLAQKSVI
jgi:hypothetical protein